MIVFRVGAYDADILEKEFAPVFTAEDLVNLGLRQIYLKLMIDSVSSQPFSATTLPPIQPPRSSYIKEITDNSRKTFARPRNEVEKKIVDWHEEGHSVKNKPSPQRPQDQAPSDKRPRPIDIRGAKLEPPIEPKPVPDVSLQYLKEKNNNQRKPDPRHVSDLREALKAVTVDQPKVEIKSDPTSEELKKILHGE